MNLSMSAFIQQNIAECYMAGKVWETKTTYWIIRSRNRSPVWPLRISFAHTIADGWDRLLCWPLGWDSPCKLQIQTGLSKPSKAVVSGFSQVQQLDIKAGCAGTEQHSWHWTPQPSSLNAVMHPTRRWAGEQVIWPCCGFISSLLMKQTASRSSWLIQDRHPVPKLRPDCICNQ